MHPITAIDSLEIFVLMDNASDPFTKHDGDIYWNESQYKYDVLERQEIAGEHYCRACNGLSLLLKIHSEGKVQTLLFDTGPDAGLIVDNAHRMDIDLRQVDAIVLSHGHFDHYGGTISALDAICKRDLPVYIHPELFLPRAFGDTKLLPVGYNLTNDMIAQHGGKVIESAEPLYILNNTVLISGEVARITNYEVGVPDEHKLKDNKWLCSPDVIDERSIILHIKNKGLCVITGCGHMGVINALRHASHLTSEGSIHVIMGGFHLAGLQFIDRIEPTLSDLKLIDPSYLVTGHCTGRNTQALLSAEFSSRHIPYGVGSYLKF